MHRLEPAHPALRQWKITSVCGWTRRNELREDEGEPGQLGHVRSICTISDIIDVSSQQVRRPDTVGEHDGGDHVLEGIMVSPNYGLFPETSGIKPTTPKICATLFRCR